jgi:hypothetical protein
MSKKTPKVEYCTNCGEKKYIESNNSWTYGFMSGWMIVNVIMNLIMYFDPKAFFWSTVTLVICLVCGTVIVDNYKKKEGK